ncbi:MAG: hypothetical protein ACLUI3_14890 [Christensenellales bacterium]
MAFSRLPLVIIYNPRLVSSPPAGFADLLVSRLRGRIAPLPRVSTSFTALATLIQRSATRTRLPLRQRARPQLSGSGEVVSAVAARNARGRDAV